MSSSFPAVFMRGGTSKGLFFKEEDLPPMGRDRDELLLRIMGSPDPLQIDGMGGTTSSTSKVIVVTSAPNNSLRYRFGQVGVSERVVDWSGNCGNLTTAVAPFALEQGIVAAPKDGTFGVNMFNVNTGVNVLAELEVRDGKAVKEGSFAIAGVPGTAAPIKTDYLNPAGAVLGALLPLGDALNEIETSFGRVEVSLVDATNPYLFVRQRDVPDDAESIEELRALAAVAAGVAPDVETSWAEKPTVPRVVLVAESEESAAGIKTADIKTVTISMGKVHRGIPMTAALALAAARTVPGSIVEQIAGPHGDGLSGAVTNDHVETVIAHPLGVTSVHAKTDTAGSLVSVGVTRTARMLMKGEVFAG